MAAIEIHRQETDSRGAYTAKVPGGTAEMTYSRAGEGMIIADHTAVPDAARGQGVGKALIERAVADARKEGRKIVPLCPYAKAEIKKHREWQDVLAR